MSLKTLLNTSKEKKCSQTVKLVDLLGEIVYEEDDYSDDIVHAVILQMPTCFKMLSLISNMKSSM